MFSTRLLSENFDDIQTNIVELCPNMISIAKNIFCTQIF